MTARDLHALLSHAAGDPRPDAELVALAPDPAALSALVRRHGPLVWATCRRMLPDPADAADAFQAVFLALTRSAGRVRQPAAVGGWLHAAAVKVCLKQRRTTVRRRLREKRVARSEAVVPVADAAWDAILAAVHEEVHHLPDGERTAFVLCELQGVPAGEAAVRLGWKPGTLTGRLSKARGRLLTRLSARGLAPAVGLTGVGTLAVPAEVMALAGPSASVSPAVVALSTEITAMVTTKHLAAAVLVTAGLLAGVGGGLVGRLDAQDPKPVAPAGGRPAGLPRIGDVSVVPLVEPAPGGPPAAGAPAAGQTRWEYASEAKPDGKKEFMDLLAKRGRDGWEFAAVVSLTDPVAGGPGTMGGPGGPGGEAGGGPSRAESMVFKRPVPPSPRPVPPSPAASRPSVRTFEVPPAAAVEVARQLPDHLRRVYPTAGEIVVVPQRDGKLTVYGSAGDLTLVESVISAGIQVETTGKTRLVLPTPPPATPTARLSLPAPPPVTATAPPKAADDGKMFSVPVKHAKASEVARLVEKLLAPSEGEQNLTGVASRFVAAADDRRNLLLFRLDGTGRPAEEQVRKLVAELDVPK